MNGVEWWCDFGTYWGFPAFAFGFLLGRLSETRKDTVMKHSRRLRGWFDKNVALLYLGVAVLALGGIVVAAAATLTNARQDDEQDHLLACFDDYASASAETSQAVRKASVTVSDATRVRDEALQDVYVFIGEAIASGEPDEAQGRALFRALLAANASLVAAQDTLATVRDNNPVPDAPSEFCNG